MHRYMDMMARFLLLSLWLARTGCVKTDVLAHSALFRSTGIHSNSNRNSNTNHNSRGAELTAAAGLLLSTTSSPVERCGDGRLVVQVRRNATSLGLPRLRQGGLSCTAADGGILWWCRGTPADEKLSHVRQTSRRARTTQTKKSECCSHK